MSEILRVSGKAVTELSFVVDLDINDISTTRMSVDQSDKLISDAIVKKYGKVVGEITVINIEELDA